jgi:DNA-binding winged helix-turn-helix (wHTH) protein/tetratricopeptide (TPR) repeat protein
MGGRVGMDEARIHRFGDCVLDVGRRTLHRGGQPIELQPKAFDLLAYLVAHRERTVGKDELQAAIWPHVIVTEASLTKAVQRSRLAVGDDADSQAVIRTVHGHGYQFVAELVAGPAATAPPKRERWSWPVWAAVAAMALAIGYGSFRYGAQTKAPKPVRIAVLPMENGTGDGELDWTRLGLMTVMADGLRKANLHVVDDGAVVRLADAQAGRGDPDAEWLQQVLSQAHGATHLLSTRLERAGDVYRIRSSVTGEGRGQQDALYTGQDLLQLARNSADRVASIVRDAQPSPRAAGAISDDPYVNESYARGKALELEGRCGEAQALFSAAMVQQPQLLEPRIAYATCARILGEPETAERVLREVLKVLDDQDPDAPATQHLKATALLRLGTVLNRTGRLEESDASYAEGEKLARELADADLVAAILVNRAYIAEDRSQFELAREHLLRALSYFRESGRPIVPGNLYGALANIDIDQGRLDEANQNYGRAIDTFRSVGDRRNEAMMLNNQGLLKREQGRLDDAAALHEASREIREDLGDRQGLGRVDDMLGLVHLARGEFDAAMPRFESALAIAREGQDRFFEAVTLGHRGDLHLERGALDAAQRDLADAVAIFRDLGNRAYTLQLSVKLAEIERRRGRLDAAERGAEEMLASARAENLDIAEIDALMLSARIAADRGDPAMRFRQLREALDRAREVGHQGAAVTASIALAQAHLETSDVAAAEPLMGTLSDAPDSYELMRLRAAWAFVREDHVAASQAMRRARDLAGQRWSQDDAGLLARYERGAT